MPLNVAQLIVPPGGPGVIGAVTAGFGIAIAPDGTISATGDLSGFDPGTTTIFGQASAPTGWTVLTTYNDYAIRVSSSSGGGSGGTTAFSSAFTTYTPAGSVSVSNLQISGVSISGASVSQSQFGNHAHTYASPQANNPSITAQGPGPLGVPVAINTSTYGAGGGGQHSHGVSGSASATGSGSFSGTSTSQFAVKYYDVIICVKS
jgi:hypothetical protein